MAASVARIARIGGTGGTSLQTPTTDILGAGMNTTTGSSFVVMLSGGSSTVTGVTDNKGNTYTLVHNQLSDNTAYCAVWKCDAGTGGSAHRVTVTTAGGEYGVVHFLEVTGTSGYDSASLGYANDNFAPNTATTGTLSQADELLLSIITSPSGSPTYTNTTMAVVSSETDGGSYWTSAVAAQNVTSTAAFTANWNYDNSTQTAVIIVGFKSSSGGSTNYPLAVDATSYAVTTSAETLRAARGLGFNATSYAVTPAAITLRRGRLLNFAPVSYAVTAAAESLAAGRKLNLDAATYSVTAAAVDFARSRALNVEAAAYGITVEDITLTGS